MARRDKPWCLENALDDRQDNQSGCKKEHIVQVANSQRQQTNK